MSLYEDTRDALLTGPSEHIWTEIRHSGQERRHNAADALADVALEAQLPEHLVMLLRDASKGEDVQLRATMMIDLIAREYAKLYDAPELTDADMARISEERRSEWKGAL